MDLSNYADSDAVGLAALVRAGEVSADEVEEAARRAVAEVDPALHASVGEPLEPSLDASLDGPFGGVPFALKEVAPHLKGQVSQLGSRWTGDGITGASDTYLGQRIRAAGFRVIARTRSPEFAFNATTEPVAHGPTCSPWDPGCSAGGSSGGAAALVAARALPIAHGTDGGGSLRIPGSLCGLVGLKPSRLRIPVGPAVWEANHGMAHDFVLCRTLRDAAAALDALHGPAPGEKYVVPPPQRPYAEEVGADPGSLRIAWTADAWSGEPVAPECRSAVEAAALALDGLGHRVEPGSPAFDADVLHRGLLTCWSTGLAQRAALLEPAVGSPPSAETVEACTLAAIRFGVSVSAVRLLEGYGDCNAVGRSIGTFFEDVDVLVLPSTAKIPWKLGELDQNDQGLDADAWVHKLFSQYVPFTAMFNITGQPAISLPLAWSEEGLPVGVQLVARYGDEATLLRLASQLEQLFPWAGRTPRVSVGVERSGR